jgi:predicted  nucleic acid-binding Zn-ribbon protein
LADENGKRIRVKDVYTKLEVLVERVNNSIKENEQDHADINVRITNLEQRIQTMKENDLKHMRGLSPKQQAAIIFLLVAAAEIVKIVFRL